jgi:hypothetical protein
MPAAVESEGGVSGADGKRKKEVLEFHQFGRGWVVKTKQRRGLYPGKLSNLNARKRTSVYPIHDCMTPSEFVTKSPR